MFEIEFRHTCRYHVREVRIFSGRITEHLTIYREIITAGLFFHFYIKRLWSLSVRIAIFIFSIDICHEGVISRHKIIGIEKPVHIQFTVAVTFDLTAFCRSSLRSWLKFYQIFCNGIPISILIQINLQIMRIRPVSVAWFTGNIRHSRTVIVFSGNQDRIRTIPGLSVIIKFCTIGSILIYRTTAVFIYRYSGKILITRTAKLSEFPLHIFDAQFFLRHRIFKIKFL